MWIGEKVKYAKTICVLGKLPKKNVFFGISFPNLFTHPRVFVRFGKTKGEIPVEKGNFRSDFSRGLDLV